MSKESKPRDLVCVIDGCVKPCKGKYRHCSMHRADCTNPQADE